MQTILVTGGAGYIGSFTVDKLIKKGFIVVIVDNLSSGNKQNMNKKAEFRELDILDKEALEKVFSEFNIDAVVHFAGKIEVEESMYDPKKYFDNNILGGLNILEAMRKNNVKNIVFSSSAAVYGIPNKKKVSEEAEKKPINFYGQTKLWFEELLEWYDKIHEIKSVCLRYFNAAGAAIDGSKGEIRKKETHVIPILFDKIQQQQPFSIFGDDYPTRDGTCVRDYIHVLDLADAHIRALSYLEENNQSNIFNVGTSEGISVKELVEQAQKITGQTTQIQIAPRRPGDPPFLVADNTKITQTLNWRPRYSDVSTILESAWKWMNRK
jgi:UDP-glucose 4-epimerase